MKKSRMLLINFALVLTSCFGTTSLEFVPYLADLKPFDTYHFDEEVNPYLIPRNAYFHNRTVLSNEITSLSQVISSKENVLAYEEGQEAHLLVVPLAFHGSDRSTHEKKTILIQNAFFGDSSKNTYESVASYYNRSSYGHVKIQGEVTDWYTSSMTADKALQLARNNSPLPVSSSLANEVVSWLDESDFDLTNYLTEDGNYVRGLYIVYDFPPDYGDTSSLFWAYVHRADKNSTYPSAATYAWSSIDFVGEKAYKNNYVETNTFIHEVGHLFGLSDYYNRHASSYYQPTSFFDMMDYNLGDHCSFSKYLLRWATPYVVNQPQEITIRSFTETGDFILIPTSSFNGTPYDEYILIEYFTPTGLNNSSSFASYLYRDKSGRERIFYYPSYHGVRIYHVDARLAYYTNQSINVMVDYVDNLTQIDPSDPAYNDTLYVGFANDNSPMDKTDDLLCHLLSARGESDYENGIAASNATLFALEDTFGKSIDSYHNFRFNKTGEYLPFSLTISKMRDKEVTVSFTLRD